MRGLRRVNSGGRAGAGMPLGRYHAALWTAGAAASLGDGIGVVAGPWPVSLLTRDPLAIALVAALRLPRLVMPLPAGAPTDRLDRRRLVFVTDGFRAAALPGLGLAVHLSGVPAGAAEGFPDGLLYWVLVAGAVAVGSAEVLRDDSARTPMPALVPPERLETANGRLRSVEIAAKTLAGPPLGG